MKVHRREDHYEVGGPINLTKTSKHHGSLFRHLSRMCAPSGHGALKSPPKQKKKGALLPLCGPRGSGGGGGVVNVFFYPSCAVTTSDTCNSILGCYHSAQFVSSFFMSAFINFRS